MEQVEIGGCRIAYTRVGSGPPLVLLHGFVGDGRSTWQSQLDELSGEFTVVAWDAPGAGRSDDPPASFRLSDYADCLAAFLQELNLGPAHIGGLSFGGVVALELVRRHPARVRTLALAGAYAGWAGSLPADVAARRLEQSLEASSLPPAQFLDTMLPTMFSRAVGKERIREFAASVAAFHPDGFRTMARACADADLRESLGGIAVPVLLLYGNEDVRAPLDVGEALHRAIPTSRLVVLDGVGHVSSVEAPDRVTREIRSFLHASEVELAAPSGG